MDQPVLVVGDACVDLVVQIPERSGSERQHPPPELHGGGTGGNTAVALARLGLPTVFLGAVGDDGYGRFALDSLEREGVDTHCVTRTQEAFTTQVIALIDRQGERTLVAWPRRGAAHTRLAPEAVQPALVAAMAWLHTTGMTLVEAPTREAVLRAMRLAREAGVPVSFDINLRLGFADGRLPEPFLETIRQAITLADVVFGSATDELVYLTPGLSAEAGARQLAAGERMAVIRQGAEGAWVVSARGEASHVPAFPVAVVDTLGAGDVFNAGFILASLAGKSLPEAVCWGHAAAALKLGRPGARSGPTRAELEAFLTNST